MTLIQNFRKLFTSEPNRTQNQQVRDTKTKGDGAGIGNVEGKEQVKKEGNVSSKEEHDKTSSGLSESKSKFSIDSSNHLYPELPSRYELLSILGEGAFSIVYKALDTKTEMTVAIKIIKKDCLTVKQLSNINNEINVMKRANDHNNILKLLNYYNTKRHCFLVLEYCNGGEIFNKIIEYTYFSEDLSRHVFKQLLSAIDYLHNTLHIVHRDIKPENLIFETIPYFERSEEEFKKTLRSSDEESKVDEGAFKPEVGGGTIGIIKLADFGLAKQLKSETPNFESALKTPCGTAGYTAPEVITCNERSDNYSRRFSSNTSKKNHYSRSVDIWSLGCFLYTILCGFPPFYDDDPDCLTSKIINGEFVFLKPWWDEISIESKDLITKMLTINPEDRITVEQIWKHPWVKNKSLDTLATKKSEEMLENYFSKNDKYQKDVHLETPGSSNTLDPPSIMTSNGLLSPRANAIKLVFNNPAMVSAKSSNLKRSKKFSNSSSSVQFIENINEYESSSEDSEISIKPTKGLPKTPNPTREDLEAFSFKDVIKLDKLSTSEEEADEVTSLDQEFNGSCRRNTSQKSSGSADSVESEDSNYQTRSSSIVSGIVGDFKFTLNLNDSNLLSRRRSSTTKSSKLHVVNVENC